MINTISTLIDKLKDSSYIEKRKETALKLAAIQNEKAHDELYRMANAEIIKYKPRTWKTLWLRFPIGRYGLDDQLIAIEALAETCTRRAYNFIKNLYKEEVDHPSNRWGSEWTYAAHSHHSNGEMVYYTYPNAKRALKYALEYSYEFEDSFDGATSTYNNTVHNLVKKAILRIEEMYFKNQNSTN